MLSYPLLHDIFDVMVSLWLNSNGEGLETILDCPCSSVQNMHAVP